MTVPEQAGRVRLAFLPPMSGLAALEDRLDPGTINVRIGEGRTADVLRNLCYRILVPEKPSHSPEGSKPYQTWSRLVDQLQQLYGITLNEPELLPERGQITMTYRDHTGVTLDISSAGRGLQQTLLLLAYMYANPGSVLLLDEPDAHLEILRQRQIYQLLADVAREEGNQVIAATHSEVVLNEAAGRDLVVAFVGNPHRLNDRGSQVAKALTTIGFDQYYLAEEKRWILYLEGSTDLSILRAFADRLNHPVRPFLERPFVHYVSNQPRQAEEHFFGLREAVPEIKGVAIYDRLETPLLINPHLSHQMWSRRELENYLCFPQVLEAYAWADQPDDIFGRAEGAKRHQIMSECIRDLVPPLALRDLSDRWWIDVKASDEFLDRLFDEYFRRLHLPNIMRKTSYYQLAYLVPGDLVPSEVGEKLDVILAIASPAESSTME